ncbi:hypothetical protein OBBRIDRAFT_15359 [Obba rivulosa]|uniref:Chromo domain-containing protein n=1 Tax=Obba rivulosa TaxID=1052685 RepID=A0A8E2J7J9_9APHY|nr:hypothetical protein OBBRIDRAFT_15359 [Obba rivulosa]
MPKKKSIKVESSSDSGSEEEGEGQFVVEVITKARAKKKNKWDYYVKWAGYGSDHNSWEPQENVEGCDRLLKSFWTNIGLDNDDYEPGHIVRATPSWIKKEKERFQKEFGAKESSEMESPEERPATAHKHTDEEPSRKPGPRKKPKKVKHEATSKASVSSSQRGRASIVITASVVV